MPKKSNKVKFGLKNVHVAPLTFAEDGSWTFGTPKHIPGAVNLSLDPQGDTEKFYADNMAYYVAAANDGYRGTMEMALIPDWFRRDYMGDVEDATDKVLVETTTAEPKAFALLFQVEGDERASLRVLYNCKATRMSESGSTTSNTKTPATDSLTVTAAPLPDGTVKAKTTADTPDETRSNWFTEVWVPSKTEGSNSNNGTGPEGQ